MARACCVSGLEAVTPFLLEKEAGLSNANASMCLSAICLAIIPLKTCYEASASYISAVRWFRYLMLVAMCATIMLFEATALSRTWRPLDDDYVPPDGPHGGLQLFLASA